jgi:PST family polysaccharide transporter
MDDLKGRAIRGGAARLTGQIANMALRLGYMVVMARLLDPKDFGLVAMVLVLTGIFDLFSTAGLSTATVQRETISYPQLSNMFWINVLVGMTLTVACLAAAPALAAVYHEDRLLWIAVALSAGFLLTGVSVQHVALLERQLKYGIIAVIDVAAQLIACALAISLALVGFGYWSLVAASIAGLAARTAGAWVATGWVPSRPQRSVEIASMLRFGGTLTLNGLVMYVAYSFDKFLLGRFWGAEVLGIYGRAFQIINIPTQTLNGLTNSVAISAMSRVQNDPVRIKSYFLKSYALVVSLTVPVTIFAALFAEDIVLLLLGPKWLDAAGILRILAPTILVFGIIDPFYSFLVSIGKQVRSLHIACVIAPLVTVSYVIGLPYGPSGVALGYSIAMCLWVVPHVIWCAYRTIVSPLELLVASWKPFAAGFLAALATFALSPQVPASDWTIVRLLIEGSILGAIYLLALIFAFGQKDLYLELLRSLRPASGPP